MFGSGVRSAPGQMVDDEIRVRATRRRPFDQLDLPRIEQQAHDEIELADLSPDRIHVLSQKTAGVIQVERHESETA